MNRASIRRFENRDLESLARIEAVSFPNAWPRELLRKWIRRQDSDCRVIEFEGAAVGFLLLIHGSDVLYLANLAVNPSHRRRGLALEALASVDAIAKQRAVGSVALEVRETNLPAQKLYRSAGYRAVEIVRGYYSDEDAYHMVKHFHTP